MEVLYPRCAGIDVHKKTVTVCVRIQQGGHRVEKKVRKFGTMTSKLQAMCDWLTEQDCSHVAMESTGVYWKPVFNLLEGHFDVVLANARHIKALPGRKTDVTDCEWIADLLAHGLIRGSFVPPAPIRELREVTRYRKSLIRERTAEINRIHKLLESANIKLGNVATDIYGVSGRAMIAGLIEGERDGTVLAELAKGALRNKKAELAEALTGRFTEGHAFLLRQIFSHIEHISTLIEACNCRIDELTKPYEDILTRLQTIPGVGRTNAEAIIAEIGVRMDQFPTARHLASWAKICPGNNESAGKRKNAGTGQANNWLRTALVESAWAASRSRNNYLCAQYRRLAPRRGKKRAVVAVAHTILVVVYNVIAKCVEYRDLGADYFDRLRTAKLTRYYLHRLNQLGVEVTPA